jgi:hypothetical protein
VCHAEKPRPKEKEPRRAHVSGCSRDCAPADRRDPGPGDPLFFDRDKDLPTPLDLSDIEDEVMQALRKVGVEPQIIYAYKKTGLIGVAGAINNWPADRRKEWEDSIDEYFALEEQAKAKRKSSHDQ